jgi:DNA-binding IclR family transcriptional regulator
MEPARKALEVLRLARRNGYVDGSLLSGQPGWNRPQASRYLRFLCREGFLERVAEKGRPRYVLGPEAMELGIPVDVGM